MVVVEVLEREALLLSSKGTVVKVSVAGSGVKGEVKLSGLSENDLEFVIV